VAAASKLFAKSFTLDGEAVVCGADGVAVFDALHRRGKVGEAILQAFDLLEFNGEDFRPLSLCERKKRLARLLARATPGIASASTPTPGRRVGVSTSLRDGLGRHRVKALGRSLQVRPVWRLDQDQEPGQSGERLTSGGILVMAPCRFNDPIEPMDLANMRENDVRALAVQCWQCRNEKIINADH
jgi:hypothetical protein